MSKSLYPAKPKETDWSFVILATGLTLFFGLLIVAMLIGVKGVESGYIYNGGLFVCI